MDEGFGRLKRELDELSSRFCVAVPRLELNSRFSTTAGRFKYWKRGEKTPLIEISKKHLRTFGVDETVKVLRHEFAHYYQWTKRKKTSHDREFKDFCRKVGGSMSESMARKNWAECATAAFIATPYKYLYTCIGCGKTVRRKRKIPKKMVCATCNTAVSRWKVVAL